ncbi:hypothetical protein ACFL08_00070 [Patescibacteria group bacterium]
MKRIIAYVILLVLTLAGFAFGYATNPSEQQISKTQDVVCDENGNCIVQEVTMGEIVKTRNIGEIKNPNKIQVSDAEILFLFNNPDKEVLPREIDSNIHTEWKYFLIPYVAEEVFIEVVSLNEGILSSVREGQEISYIVDESALSVIVFGFLLVGSMSFFIFSSEKLKNYHAIGFVAICFGGIYFSELLPDYPGAIVIQFFTLIAYFAFLVMRNGYNTIELLRRFRWLANVPISLVSFGLMGNIYISGVYQGSMDDFYRVMLIVVSIAIGLGYLMKNVMFLPSKSK